MEDIYYSRVLVASHSQDQLKSKVGNNHKLDSNKTALHLVTILIPNHGLLR